jgi:hypothetical protein
MLTVILMAFAGLMLGVSARKRNSYRGLMGMNIGAVLGVFLAVAIGSGAPYERVEELKATDTGGTLKVIVERHRRDGWEGIWGIVPGAKKVSYEHILH